MGCGSMCVGYTAGAKRSPSLTVITHIAAAESLDNVPHPTPPPSFHPAARLQKHGYRTVKNPMTVHLHPTSSLIEDMPRWVIYHELVLTSKEFMRTVTAIQPEWLVELAPHYYFRKEIDQGTAKRMPLTVGRSALASD